MFRRKGEESLFDTPNDQPLDDNGAVESGVQANTNINKAPLNSVAGANAPTPPSGQPNNPLSRPSTEPRGESRPERSAPTSNFRPASSPLGGTNKPSDMGRGRMPETKSVTTNSNINTGTNVDKTNAKVGGNRRVLTVGNDILLKGEIATCDRLVIEGKVDATLNDVHTVEISETGSFKGSARIEDAEISGLFEGDLVVSNRLVIYASGKVRGKITYGEIEIERGGELTGEIKTNAQEGSETSSRPSRAKKDDMVAA